MPNRLLLIVALVFAAYVVRLWWYLIEKHWWWSFRDWFEERLSRGLEHLDRQYPGKHR